MNEFSSDYEQEVRIGGMPNRGKRYDAILTLKAKIEDIFDDQLGMTPGEFEDNVRWEILHRGIFSLIEPDDIEVIDIQQVIHGEQK